MEEKKSIDSNSITGKRSMGSMNLEQIKERVIYRLVSAEANREILSQIPHIPYLDLAIVFVLLLKIEDEWQLSHVINNQDLEQWGIRPEELYRLAEKNTPRMLPASWKELRSILMDFVNESELDDIPELDPHMYVLTNQEGLWGAAAILYPDMLKNIADWLEADLVILPSSIHEIIIMPEVEKGLQGEALEAMVREVNQKEVMEEEVLSYRVYRYDRETEQLDFYKRREGDYDGADTNF